MPIITCGINHATTPLSIREQLAFDQSNTIKLLQQLVGQEAINEAVLLSTCNRTEIYTDAEHQFDLQAWFNQQYPQAGDLSHYCYQHQGIEALKHLMRVATGLDSMVLGEPQILGQIKQAFATACQAGSVGDQLNRVFPAVFAATKQIRHQTQIGCNPVTIAYAVTQLAKQIFSDLKQCRVLLIGAGETVELMLNYMHQCGVRDFVIANRTLDNAHKLADPVQGLAIRIGDVPTHLASIDIVITATASQLPILGKGMLERTLKQKKRRPLFMADLAVPRDIEPEVAELEDIYLYNLDDLQQIIQQNRQDREAAAQEAEAMIDIQAHHYIQQLRVIGASDMIRSYRSQLRTTCDKELAKAMQQLAKGHQPDAVLREFAHTVINKVMHQPTMALRDAAYHGDVDLLLHAKKLLDL